VGRPVSGAGPGGRPPATPRGHRPGGNPGPGRPPAPARRTAARPAVLALDGGNSKTDVALVAADGSLLASGRGPGVRTFPTPPVLDAIGSAASLAACDAGLAGTFPVADHTVACMANADLPEEEERLAGQLAEQGWSVTTEVANDTFAVLRAGLDTPAGPPWGVAVTCGAGINCQGRAPDGRTTGFLALGGITGDWGGSLGLGRAALWWAMRAEDGRGPQTALRDAVAAHFRVTEVREVAVAIHLDKVAEDDLAGLTPQLLALASRGDQVAVRLVSRLADEIVTMAGTVLQRLELTGRAVPVVLGGGMLTARNPQLTGWITERLAAVAPLAEVRVTSVPPIAGAALLGLDHSSPSGLAAPAAEARLRAAYLPRP
jgi:N-acetylglucosamine kinase-like BadF-type ATPase